MIHHVSLECRRGDEPALLAFWHALGFERVAAPGSLAERATWVQSGPTQVHLLWAAEPVVPPSGHVAIHVADLDATLATLRGLGVHTEERTAHWGAPRFYAHAPGGHLVELFATAP